MGLTHWSLCMCPPDEFWEGWEHTIKQKKWRNYEGIIPTCHFYGTFIIRLATWKDTEGKNLQHDMCSSPHFLGTDRNAYAHNLTKHRWCSSEEHVKVFSMQMEFECLLQVYTFSQIYV